MTAPKVIGTASTATTQTQDGEPIEAKPEGRPTYRGMGKGKILLLLALALISMLIVSVVIGLAVSPAMGVGLGILAIILAIASPVCWASMQRAAERA